MTTQQILNTLTSLQNELNQADWLETEPLRDRILEMIELMGSMSAANSAQAVDSQKLEKIASAIRKTGSLDSLLNTTVSELKKVLDVSRALVYRFENKKSGVVAAEALVRGFTPMIGESIPLEGFGLEKSDREASYYYKQINNIEEANLTPYQNQTMERYQVKTSACVPILHDNSVWGLLVVQQCNTERIWLESDIALLDAVAQEMFVQLQVADIRGQLEQKVAGDRVLSQVTNKILESKNIDNIFNYACDSLRNFIKCDRVSIYKFDDNWNGEFVTDSRGAGWVNLLEEQKQNRAIVDNINSCSVKDLANKSQFIANGDTYIRARQGKIFDHSQIYRVTNDIYNSGFSDCYIQVLESYQAKAYIISAIYRNNELWGLIAAFQNSDVREWTQEEIDLVAETGKQLKVAVQQDLYRKQIEANTLELQRKANREKTLSGIVEKVRNSLEIQNLFDITVREIRRFMDADRVGVFMFYPNAGYDDGEFVAEDVVGGYPSAIKNKIHDHCFGDQYADQYANGKVQAVSDIYNSGLSDCHIDVLSDYEIKANLIVPLIKNKQLWGLLAVHQCSAPREWQQEDIEFIQQVAAQFGVALQQAEALKQSKLQLQREKTLSGIVEKIRKSLNLQELFNTTVKEVRRYIKADRVAVFEFFPGTNFDDGEFVAEDVNANYPSAIKEKIHDHCFGDQYADKYADGYVQSVADIYEEGLLSDCHIEILSKFEIRANLIVPLIRNKELWGLMAVHQCSAPRKWQQDEIKFIQEVAAQFGVALQQAEALKQTQQQLKRERAIQSIVSQVRQNIDLQLIFNSTCREVRQFLDADRVGIFKFDPGSDYNYGSFIAEDVLNEYTSAVKAKVKDHCFASKYGDKRKMWISVTNNVEKSDLKSCHKAILGKFEVKANLVIPLFVGDELWGLFAIHQCDAPRNWQTEEIEFGKQVTSQLGIALQQREYLKQVEERNADLDRIGKLDEEITKIIEKLSDSQGEIKEFFNYTCRQLRQLLGCDRISVYKFYPNWGGEYIAESVGSQWNPLVGDGIKTVWDDTHLQETQGGRYIKGETYVAHNIYEMGHQQCHTDLLEQFQVKSYIIAPIFAGKKLWGLLAAYQNDDFRHWKDDEQKLVTKLGSQLGIGIKQAEYIENLQNIAEAEQALTNISNRVRQVTDLDMDSTLSNIVSEARNLLKCDRVAIIKFGKDCSQASLVESVGKDWMPWVSPSGNKVFTDDNLQETNLKVYRQGKPVVANDIYAMDYPQCYVEVLEESQVKSYVTASIFVDGELWGWFGTYQNGEARNWKDYEITIIEKFADQTGVAIEQVQSFRELQDKNAQLEQTALQEKTLARAIDQIRQAQDLDSVFRNVLPGIRGVLKCDRVSVYQFMPDWSGVYVAESVGNEWNPLVGENIKTIWEDTHLQETKGGRYANGETYVGNNIYEMGHQQCHIDLLEQFQVKAYVIAPIFVGKKLWGLFAAYQNDDFRHWADRDVNLITQVGTQLGLGIQQAESFKELERKNNALSQVTAQEKALGRAMNSIRQVQDMDSVFRSILPDFRGVIQCDRMSVYKFLPDWGGEYVAESVGSEWVPLVGENIRTVWSDTHLQETQGGRYAKGETYVANSIYEMGHLQCHIDLLEQFQVQAYVIAPIFVGEKLWGLLAAYQNTGARQWTQSEVDLITRLGSQLGVGLQQSEYVKELQKNTQESARKAERESNIIRFSSRLVETLTDLIQKNQDSQAIFKFATRELRRILKTDRVGVFKFHPDFSGEFITESVDRESISLVGTELARVSDTYLQENQGGRYARKESIAIPDIYNADHTDCHIELLEKWGTKAYAIAPIFKGNKLWGLLGMYQNSAIRHWEASEIAILEQVGTQIGITLQFSEFFNQVQEQEIQLQTSAQKEKEAREQLQMEALKMLRALQPSFQGDLTVRAPMSETELGTIADGYNTTITSLRELVKQVKDAAVKVGETSDQSSFSVTQLSSQAQQQTSQMKDALQQLQAMVRATEAVANNAQKVEYAVQEANKTVNAGDSMMERTVDEMLEIRETVSQTAKKIKRLGESSQKISKVVNLIENFATQTNLLALNAAIEATRAGEYGKGFAVVADEVRSLAYQSASATTEIEHFVQDIQKEINEVTEVMEVGISQVVKGSDLVDETRSSLSAIVLATNEISSLVAGITQTANNQSQQSQTLTSAMTEVSQVAQKTSESSMQISESFRKLLTTSQNLQTSVSKFKVD